jgi:hypothetical protein
VFAPRFVCWRGLLVSQRLPFPEVHRAYDTLLMLQDPWVPPDTPSNAVICWRLLFPLAWYWLKLPVWLFLVMPLLGCVLALWLATWLTHQRLGNWQQTSMAVMLFAALPWFFVSTGWLTYFDSWLVLGLLVVGFTRSRVALAVTCLVTPWIDERFVLALPVTLAVRSIALRTVEERQWRAMWLDLAVVVAASLPYPAVRAVAWLHGDPDSTIYVQTHWTDFFGVPPSRFLEGLWSGYRTGWAMVIAAIWLWAKRVGWKWGACFAAIVLGTSLGALCIAADMSRTLAIAVPVLLVGVWLWHDARPRSFAYALPVVLAANLLLPAEHVVWPFKIPIRYLYTQFDAYRNPPLELRPETYADIGTTMLQQRDRAGAHRAFDTAIRLDKQFAPGYVGRAALHLVEGDAAAALADAETALRLQPGQHDALFIRAAVRESRGEKAAAAADLMLALAQAPADWPQREQAQRFLNQARGQEPANRSTSRP